ncbi:MAG: aminoglycoside phosphotransferase family protein [Actinomycetota bacterium]|nr:aminoglycoside phosphotransferase family protein [Actinomycetota bacterium]
MVNGGSGARIPTTQEAVAASVSCARSLGLAAGDPVVVAEGYSVRVHLRPAPVLTRVVTAGCVLRGDPRPWQEREIAVAQFLARSGVPAVVPWSEPGPHLVNGLWVSLWQWTDHQPGAIGQADFGQLLDQLHEALLGYRGQLPPLVGPLTDVNTALTISSDPLLHEAAGLLVPLALSWPQRPLHGDAHTGNVLISTVGPVWADLEDVCVGPVEWDLASTTVTEEAVTAYPGPVDDDRLEDCRALRRLQILAGVLTDDVADPSLYEETVSALQGRLATLRSRAG